MTNDTNTLNGALAELGETMAANLVTMGVNASASDGLTTLAGKILDIVVTPSAPDSITLTADKSILSYAGSESATLSATVLDSNSQPCSGETVEFFKGGVSMGTSQTDANGVASMSYSSGGVGDVSFTAESRGLSSTVYILEDCYFYDPVSSDNTSSYTITSYKNSGYTFTYNSDGYYVLKDTNTASPSVFPDKYATPIKFECDMYIQSKSNDNDGILISDSNGRYRSGTNSVQGNAYEVFSYGGNKGLSKIENSSWVSVDRPSGALSTGKWYHMLISINGTTVNAQIKEGTTSVFSKTYNSSFTISEAYPIMYTHGTNNNIRFKNIKVKKI